MNNTTNSSVFAKAVHAHWTHTTLGPRCTVSHGGYTWHVELPASGHGQASITGREGYGGTEFLSILATWEQTIDIVGAAVAALRPY